MRALFLGIGVEDFWRFRGSYKWTISPVIWVITIVIPLIPAPITTLNPNGALNLKGTLLITPLLTTHEPPIRMKGQGTGRVRDTVQSRLQGIGFRV